MKSKKSVEIISNPVLIYLKGIIVAVVFVLFLFLIMALLITYTNISEALIPLFAAITMVVSALISGMYVGAKIKKKGWLIGVLEGCIYVVFLILISWVFMEDFNMNSSVLYKGVIGIASGGLGGIIGVNLK